MSEATLRYNPDRSLAEVQVGPSEDDVWSPLDATEAGHVLVDEESGESYYLALTDDEGLTPDTLYRLEPVEITVEEDVEIESEDEEEEEETSGAD